MSLSSVVDVSVSIESARVASAGFGIPLILVQSQTWDGIADRVIFVESASELVSDYDFDTTDPEYVAASRMFSQDPAPNKIALGFREEVPEQKHTIFPASAPVEGSAYRFHVNTEDLTSEDNEIEAIAPAAPDAEDIVDLWITALAAQFPDLDTAKVGAGALAVLEITGEWRSIVVDPRLVKVTQNHNSTTGTPIAEDLDAMALASSEWYGVISLVPSKAEALEVAEWVEANEKLFVVASQDFDCITSATDDLFSTLASLSYARTVPIFDRWNGSFADAAWAGECLSFDPGSATWKFKTLAGVPILYKLSTSEIAQINAKKGNAYITLGGRNITSEGVVSAGEFADVIHFRDWLVARIGERVFARLASAKKIPYTDGGIAILESDVKAQLSEGVTIGGLAADPAPVTTVPKVASVNPADKAARTLKTITFSATLAGAVHKLVIRGTVTA